MSVVRYECSSCQTLFVPPEEVSPGAYARCPNCGAVSVQAASADDNATGDGSDPGAQTALENPVVGASAAPAPLFSALLSGEPSVPDIPPSVPDEVTLPPGMADGGGDAPAPAGGLFSNLLAENAPDLDTTGTLDLPRDVTGLVPTLAQEPPAPSEAPLLDVPRDVTVGGIPLLLQQAAPAGSGAQAPVLAQPFDVANTGMLVGPVTTGEVPLLGTNAVGPEVVPPPPFDIANTGMVLGNLTSGEIPIPALPRPPVTGSGVYLDKETFSDEEFEALVGGSFARPGGPSVTQESSGPEGWVVTQPPRPPPLKKNTSMVPVLPAAPLPQASLEPAADPQKLLAGLAPIPAVSTLGPVPRLVDATSMTRGVVVAALALVLGVGAGMGLAPAPEKPPTAGPEGARHKLGLAHRLLAEGKDAEAVPLLEGALGMDERLAEAYFALGVAYARLEKFDEAARAYATYAELRPRDPKVVELENAIRRYNAGKPAP